MSKRYTLAIELILATITFIEAVDIVLKIASCITAIVVGYFAIRAYISKRHLEEIQIEIEKRKLENILKESEDKHEEPK